MGSDSPVVRRGRGPEKLPLPDAAAGVPVQPAITPPFFLQLEQDRAALQQSFEATRTGARKERIKKLQDARNSRVVVYYSIGMLSDRHAELLQDVLSMRAPGDNLDLFLLSPGGYSDAAFKMVALCRSYARRRFSVIIPYYAKSAATLLSLGADELVMGPASEIGPIDPRIMVPDQYGRLHNVSATSIKDALEMLEDRVRSNPPTAVLYAPLLEKVDIYLIGEYERALKSAEQYAERLLAAYMLKGNPMEAKRVAGLLARQYFSHGYAIDRAEARSQLSLNVTDASVDEWNAMWQLHKLYETVIEDSAQGGGRIQAIFESEDIQFFQSAPPSQAPGGNIQPIGTRQSEDSDAGSA